MPGFALAKGANGVGVEVLTAASVLMLDPAVCYQPFWVGGKEAHPRAQGVCDLIEGGDASRNLLRWAGLVALPRHSSGSQQEPKSTNNGPA